MLAEVGRRSLAANKEVGRAADEEVDRAVGLPAPLVAYEEAGWRSGRSAGAFLQRTRGSAGARS